MIQIKKKYIVIIVTVSFALGVICSAVISSFGSSNTEEYEKLDEIRGLIETTYYKKTDSEVLIDGACKGMVDALNDPYSTYMSAKEYKTWLEAIHGEYFGIGVTFTTSEDNKYIVLAVEPKSPAEKAGIKAGDVILKVDGKTYDNIDLMANAIKGEEGTTVKVTYEREGNINTSKITRKKIIQHSVENKMIDEKTGYIAISSFAENTGNEFSEAIKNIKKEGATELILDLRNNGGGLITSCIEVADEFLDEGVAVYVEDRNGKRDEYTVEDGKTTFKTVVLINENSASAAEILAAAMQDNGYKVIGKTSFGKGVIQSTVELKDGSAVKWTIMQYFSPKGTKIDKIGVTPDYQIDNSESEDLQLNKALEIVKTL